MGVGNPLDLISQAACSRSNPLSPGRRVEARGWLEGVEWGGKEVGEVRGCTRAPPDHAAHKDQHFEHHSASYAWEPSTHTTSPGPFTSTIPNTHSYLQGYSDSYITEVVIDGASLSLENPFVILLFSIPLY